MPWQQVIDHQFPKAWSDLLWIWHHSNCNGFLHADQWAWELSLLQAFFKRRYLTKYIKVSCWTSWGNMLEVQEDASVALLDQSRGQKMLYVVYRKFW
jgi:hypothetical protein